MNTWTHFNIPSALTIVPWAKHPLNLGRSHQTHTHISSSVIFFFNPLPFFHSLFYYLTFIFGFVDVCDNTEANMRADRFGRKPLTGIIRVEVEEWRRGGWKEQMSGGRLTVFDLRGTWPPPGCEFRDRNVQEKEEESGSVLGKRWRCKAIEEERILWMHHGRKEWS